MNLKSLAVILLISYGDANFTPDFKKFLQKKYGEVTQQQLERLDLGHGLLGSFGGKTAPNEVITKRPVIFVHGATSRAWYFVGNREYLLKNGYQPSELYATSYGDGGRTALMDISIDCNFIKQIRNMIIAVHEYTQKRVDIVAWSMGSIISRKAILGGKCTETTESLGPTITDMVDTFISIGGTNYGMETCPRTKKACNPLNSMNCGSALLKELNSQPQRYEGIQSYSIYSLSDSIIGRVCCNQICGELANANQSFEKRKYNHLALLTKTRQMQLQLLGH